MAGIHSNSQFPVNQHQPYPPFRSTLPEGGVIHSTRLKQPYQAATDIHLLQMAIHGEEPRLDPQLHLHQEGSMSGEKLSYQRNEDSLTLGPQKTSRVSCRCCTPHPTEPAHPPTEEGATLNPGWDYCNQPGDIFSGRVVPERGDQMATPAVTHLECPWTTRHPAGGLAIIREGRFVRPSANTTLGGSTVQS